ncbi:hypothetical protein JXQ70_19875 [bacterium]|nr:hypothetical protein [bacterium]
MKTILAKLDDETHRMLKVICAVEKKTIVQILTELIKRYFGELEMRG